MYADLHRHVDQDVEDEEHRPTDDQECAAAIAGVFRERTMRPTKRDRRDIAKLRRCATLLCNSISLPSIHRIT
jgi:hypothetical protein